MKEIRKVIYENRGQFLIINICDKNEIIYNNIPMLVDEKTLIKYLQNLYLIINNWDEKYINTKTIDNSYWKLSIIYTDGNKREYMGKSKYPNNFESFERLNLSLVDEVQNG